jgi:hypothetical protein
LLHWLHELPDFGDAFVALKLVLASVQDALVTFGRAHASDLAAQLRRAGPHCKGDVVETWVSCAGLQLEILSTGRNADFVANFFDLRSVAVLYWSLFAL